MYGILKKTKESCECSTPARKRLKPADNVQSSPMPNNSLGTVAMKGSMNQELMNTWKREVWKKRQTPLIRMKKSVMLMDSYAAHIMPSILSSF